MSTTWFVLIRGDAPLVRDAVAAALAKDPQLTVSTPRAGEIDGAVWVFDPGAGALL